MLPVNKTSNNPTQYARHMQLQDYTIWDLFIICFWATVCKTVRPMHCLSVCPVPHVLSCLSVTLVYCGQTVWWIKMKLGRQVGLGPGHIVLDGDPAPHPLKGTQPPIFGPYPLRPSGCIDQDATWYGGRRRPRRLVLDGVPAPPPPKGGGRHHFRPMLIVAKWLDGSRWYLAWRYASAQGTLC